MEWINSRFEMTKESMNLKINTICKTERKKKKLVVVKFPEGKERKRCKVFEEIMFLNLPNLMKKNFTSKKLSKFLIESTQRYSYLTKSQNSQREAGNNMLNNWLLIRNNRGQKIVGWYIQSAKRKKRGWGKARTVMEQCFYIFPE